MKPSRLIALLALIVALAACATSGGRRVSEPAASIQQLTIDARGNWSVELRLQNYSNVSMRFGRIDLALSLGGAKAGDLSAAPALDIGPESADVVTFKLTPTAEARLQAADALAGGRGVAYSLKGEIAATPDSGSLRTFRLERSSALNPAPGLPGVLR
ncbi:hypothetical protein EBB59_04675 [Lysobacter pythonis]|uniref:Late embryogenesis abundant protein LEA-2 subgroup domain-containing protein n=1 Tax=Solilutibacter pythonis TaxID=2483112 RepID=A0A3M2HUZ3_9GAMM|nr:LEA type 2 family protein [Lysobacter pythonis]RMH93541.1 hypothetical protein EBB59_04675 [Lysobacter pythonis]